MFLNSYQNGPYLQVFDSKSYTISIANREKNQFYQQLYKPSKEHAVRRYFDKQMKGYLFEIQGHNNKLVMPKDQHKQLCLVQQFLVFQILVNQNQSFSIELTVTDTSKRRIVLMSVFNKIQKKIFHVNYPLDSIRKGLWLNLSIDVYSFMAAFKGQTFRSLDQIIIGSSCRLKRIFTMRQPLIQISNQLDQYADRHVQGVFVPKQYVFPIGITYANQMLSYRQQLYDEKQIKLLYHDKNLKEIKSTYKDTFKTFKENQVNNFKNAKNKQKNWIGRGKEAFSDMQVSQNGLNLYSNKNMRMKDKGTKLQSKSKISKVQPKKQKEEMRIKDQQQLKKKKKKFQVDIKKIQLIKEADRKIKYQKKYIKQTRKSFKQKNKSQFEENKQSHMILLHNKNKINTNKLDINQHSLEEEDFAQHNYLIKKKIQEIQKKYQKQQTRNQNQDHIEEQIKDIYNFESNIPQEIAKSQQNQSPFFDSFQNNKSYLKCLKQQIRTQQSKVIISEDNKHIDVVYDPYLKCYYNQQTNTYYDIKQ